MIAKHDKIWYYEHHIANVERNEATNTEIIVPESQINENVNAYTEQLRLLMLSPDKLHRLMKAHLLRGITRTSADVLSQSDSAEQFYYFYETAQPFSQWHRCLFTVDGLEYSSAEQYMMYGKARLFDNNAIAEQIRNTNDVRKQKELGRQVTGFDLEVWQQHALDIVYAGNKAKFTQNQQFMDLLMSTQGKTLVEASPTDVVWGIGYTAADAGAADVFKWRGTNWLGVVLTELRHEIRGK